MTHRTFRRVAVFNRGEAAVRFMRAQRELDAERGERTTLVAFLSTPDLVSQAARLADEVVHIGAARTGTPEGPVSTYCVRAPAVARLAAARCDAVWPGWGLASEDAEFVALLEHAGIAFMGPPSAAMRALGDKIASKRHAKDAGLPVAPWAEIEATSSPAGWRAQAASIGFPVMVKASAGGGGRGIRRVETLRDLEAAIAGASGEAGRVFRDGRLFLEQAIDHARHVEVQFVVDTAGSAHTLGIRDCSTQRRHQKLIEETPAPRLDPRTAEAMEAGTRRLVSGAGYRGVGTAEFLVTGDGQAVFLEVNSRLQVEHTVTEELYGCDLVRAQILIARGESWAPPSSGPRGHAIELRVNAENPDEGFRPSPGRVPVFSLPYGPGVRVDTGLAAGDTIPPEFDSLIAKVIVWAPTREAARARARRALDEMAVVVEGGATNKAFLRALLDAPEFVAATHTTRWLEGGRAVASRPDDTEFIACAAVAILTADDAALRAQGAFFRQVEGGVPRTPDPPNGQLVNMRVRGHQQALHVCQVAAGRYEVEGRRGTYRVVFERTGENAAVLDLDGVRHRVLHARAPSGRSIEVDGALHSIHVVSGGGIAAPAPAMVVSVLVAPGDAVEAGQRLCILEAMKMELPVVAPTAGTIRHVHCRRSTQVAAGELLFALETTGAGDDGLPAGAAPLPVARPADVLFAEGLPRPELLESLPVRFVADVVADLDALIRSVMLGYDSSARTAAKISELFGARLEFPGLRTFDHWAPLVSLLEVFADVEQLFSRELEDAPDRGTELSPHLAFLEFCRRCEEGHAAVPDMIADRLAGALRHYDARIDDTAALRRALWRMATAHAHGALRHHVCSSLLRLLVGLAAAGLDVPDRARLGSVLDRVALFASEEHPSVTDNAHQASYLLFKWPDYADPRLSAEVDAAPDLMRAREEVGRLCEFDLREVPAAPGLIAFEARARTNPRDERVFVIGEVAGPPDPTLGWPELAFERVYFEGLRVIRAAQASRQRKDRFYRNRLTIFVREPVWARPEAIPEIAAALETPTRRLGLESVHIHLRLAEPSDPDGAPVELVLSKPGRHRLDIRRRAPATHPIAPITPYEQRVVAARRLGLVYPYEVIAMLEGRGSEAVSSALGVEPGSFVEHDFDASGAFVPVDRPRGRNVCGVVIGLISNPTRTHPEGIERVFIASDPTRALGALAEPECRRIIAALEIARTRVLPVEWIAVSSGAKIAMDSGTENLDWTARVLRHIVDVTQAGGEINVIVPGVNVGAQSYWNAEATMLMHTRGVLIMTRDGSMILTGKRALEYSGSVSAEDERGIGGPDRVMGPNGQAQYVVRDLGYAYATLFDHYRYTWRPPGRPTNPRQATSDPVDRDICASRYEGAVGGFERIGDIFAEDTNPGRKRPFAVRALMGALIDADAGRLERWRPMRSAEMVVVWDCCVGGFPVCLVGIESQSLGRVGHVPADGPERWTGSTLFPRGSKKLARAINAASGNRPLVVLANLSGFDGSPESLRRLQLEYGAEVARGVVNFRGPLIFVVVGRYHGGAYVVFSKALNPEITSLAVEGSFASVIGGAPAAAVVFPREVATRAAKSPRVVALRAALAEAPPERQPRIREELEEAEASAVLDEQIKVAAEFDAIHTVYRAVEVGSLDAVVPAARLRAEIVTRLERRSDGRAARDPEPEAELS